VGRAPAATAITRGLENLQSMQYVTQTSSKARVFFSVLEVSEMFGISPKSVYRLLKRGLLKSSSALRHKRISKDSIESFIATTVNNGGAQ